jgi:hypothetical protein
MKTKPEMATVNLYMLDAARNGAAAECCQGIHTALLSRLNGLQGLPSALAHPYGGSRRFSCLIACIDNSRNRKQSRRRFNFQVTQTPHAMVFMAQLQNL